MSDELNTMFGDDSDADEDCHSQNQSQNQSQVTNGTNAPTGAGTSRPPICAVKAIAGMGGGRGVFASCSIPPGVLIVAEIPVTGCTIEGDSEAGIIQTIIDIVTNPLAMDCVNNLHPQAHNMASVSEIELNAAKAVLVQSVVDEILAAVEGISPTDVFRIFLVLQHNGFNSGLYKQLTMINHSCKPNCIKFTPTKASQQASEIWSVAPIACGDEISISYCSDAELSISSIQEYLDSHHHFKCCCQFCQAHSIELASRGGEVYSLFVGEITAIEKSWEDDLDGIDKELLWIKVEDSEDALTMCVDLWSAAKQLIPTYLEKIDVISREPIFAGDHSCVAAVTFLQSADSNRPLRIRTFKCIVNTSAALVECIGNATTKAASTTRGLKETLGLALLDYVTFSITLLEQQIITLGSCHPDIATTHLDIAEGLSSLLANFPELGGKLRVEYGYPWAGSQGETKAFIVHHKKQGNRIKKMYNTRVRFPESYKYLHQPGDVYWNDDCIGQTAF